MSEGKKKFEEVNTSVISETVQLQPHSPGTHISESSSNNVSPLRQESVWLNQQSYENSEALYYMHVASLETPQEQSGKSQRKKREVKPASDVYVKKLQAEESALLRSMKNITLKLKEVEKAHNQKADSIKDLSSRISTALEECQFKLNAELTQSAAQLSSFRSLVAEVEAVCDQINGNLAEKRWGVAKTGDTYCQNVAGRLSKLGPDLNSCLSLFNSFQTDVPKLDITHIVGEISNISFIRKYENEKFIKMKTLISSEIQSLMEVRDDQNSDSDTSLEGSCSVYSDDSEHETKINVFQGSTIAKAGSDRSGTSNQDSKQSLLRSNRNNANAANMGNRAERIKVPVPVKRNSQGAQSTAYKKSDLFQFKGTPSNVLFSSQPGLLGPRPDILPLQATNQQIPLQFSHLLSAGQQQSPSVANFGAIPNMNQFSGVGQPRFGHLNFSFANAQPPSFPFNFRSSSMAQKPLMAYPTPLVADTLARNNMVSQVKQQNQIKAGDQLFTVNPFQQNPRTLTFMQNSQSRILGGSQSSFQGNKCIINLEQQLNELSKKIQQMQLSSNQNLCLQHLMLETERLKQLATQKQHQKQDHLNHQFQLLINAFMQQQQQQAQASQPKIARSVQFYNSQKQRLIHNRQQLQLRKQKQQSIAQPVKQETQQQITKDDSFSKTTKQENLSGQTPRTTIQNGDAVSLVASKRKIISKDSEITRIGTFSPHAHGDKHRAGVSSLVLIENTGCVVAIDIINGCLKMYSVTVADGVNTELTHHLVTRLELSRPYYMSRLSQDKIVVSREGKILSLVRLSKNRLEFLQDIRTESQYYGLGYIKDNLIVCAAFTDGKIDLLSIKDGNTQAVTLLTQCKAPELVAAVPSTGCVLYLERAVNETVHLLGISQQGGIDFSIDLKSSPTDVWSVASIRDKIVCCSKQNGIVKLFSETGAFLGNLDFPRGALNQPFAMAFCNSGNMYIANDGAWDSEYEHYVTTDINVYSFS